MINITVCGTFICDPIIPTVSFWSNKSNDLIDIKVAPYNQTFHHLARLPEDNINNINFSVILLRFEDLEAREYKKLQENCDLLINAIKQATQQHINRSFIVCICPPSVTLNNEWLQLLNKEETRIATELGSFSRVYVLTSKLLQEKYYVENYCSAYSEELGHIPYSQSLYVALGTLIYRQIYTLTHNLPKVIVVDCDNTLWDGVCSEVGAEGVQITKSHQELQKLLIEQHAIGRLICLASKNSQDDVFQVFERNKNMLLNLNHITAYKINWERKSKNIISLSKELNLGLDSFIFLDDNPIECAEVGKAIPEITVLQVPSFKEIPCFLQHVWLLDINKVTEEDKLRNTLYIQNQNRAKCLEQSFSLKEFIDNLNISIEILEPGNQHIARIVQLTQRTNQFNLATIRLNESQVAYLLTQQEYHCRIIQVKDRFGDYGIVGMIIFRVLQDKVEIQNFLLSCRILERGIEHKVVAWLGEYAAKYSKKINNIEFLYKHTTKNYPIYSFLGKITNSTYKDHYFQKEQIVFSLAVPDAITLQFNPEDNRSTEDLLSKQKAEETKPTDHNDNTQQSNNLTSITIELYNVELIQKAIQAFLRQSRKQVENLSEYVSPSNSYEHRLTRLIESILSFFPIGIKDNLFDLGINSMLTVQLCSLVHQEFKIELNLQDVYDYPTISELSELIYKRHIRHYKKNYEEIAPIRTIDPYYPLSFGQNRIYLLHKLMNNKSIYNVTTGLRIKGNLNISKLENSINLIMQQQNILRSVVIDNNEEYKQSISDFTFAFSKENITLCLEEEKIDRIDEYIKQETSNTFDLQKGPLIRGKLVTINNSEHLMLISMHHIISDEYSWQLFYKMLSKLYNTSNDTITSNFECFNLLPIQYVDFAIWQRKLLSRDLLEKQRAYWKQQLLGASGFSNLPVAKHRPPQPSYNGAEYEFELDETTSKNMIQFSRKQRGSLFTSLLTVLYVLLYKYTCQEDIIIGTPIANRHYPGVQDLIGFFINTLPLRISINKEYTFKDLLQKVRKVVLEAHEHQDLPFEDLLNQLQIKRNLSCHPLFQVMLVFKEQQKSELELDELQVQFEPIKQNISIFDLTIQVEIKSNINIKFIYASDLFEKAMIIQMARHFKNLFSQVLLNPDSKISNLEILDCLEKQDILKFSKGKELERDYFIIQKIFEKTVQQFPDAIAIMQENNTLTYEHLNKISNKLGNFLRQQYVPYPKVNKVIAVIMEPCFGIIISFISILKAGGIYLPLDPNYPDERIKFILQDAKASAVITQSKFIKRFQQYQIPKLDILDFNDDYNCYSSSELINFTQPNDLAYIIYTSGSTGKPKGVMIKHEGVCNLAYANEEIFCFNVNKPRILQFSSISFDVSIWEMVIALFSGGTACLLPTLETRFIPEELIRTCNEENVAMAIMPPSLLEVFPEHLNLPSIQTLIVAGEAPSTNVIHKWSKKVKYLFNAYGPTETTVFSSIFRCNTINPATTIGHPIVNTQIYILDPDLNLTPIGVVGEIYIGGVGLANGYLNNEAQTIASFINIPNNHWNNKKQLCLYKTGDLAKYSWDGNIEYLGRMDHQIKLHGYRIELGEIESLLNLQPEIKQSLVVVRENSNSQEQLIAYIVTQKEAEKEQSKLLLYNKMQNYLREHLPHYMIPNKFVLLDYFPLNDNGKVDFKMLPDPFAVDNTSNIYNESCLCKDPIQFILINVWKKLLNIEHVNIYDDFFSLGGNSILGMKLILEIQHTFNQVLSINSILKNFTIESLATLIRESIARQINSNPTVTYAACLLPINNIQSSNTPLFLIHPLVGIATPYLALSNFKDRPIYGIHNPYFAQNNSFTTLEEMAEFYIKAINLVQNEGPYYIGGWSFGGTVALEIASQLVTQNKQVGVVILIDTYLKTDSQVTLCDNTKLLEKLNITKPSLEYNILQVELTRNLKLLENYIPKKYCGRVALLKAEDDIKVTGDSIFNNLESIFEQNLEVYSIPGTHTELFEEQNIEELSVSLQFVLEQKPNSLNDKKLTPQSQLLPYITSMKRESLTDLTTNNIDCNKPSEMSPSKKLLNLT